MGKKTSIGNLLRERGLQPKSDIAEIWNAHKPKKRVIKSYKKPKNTDDQFIKKQAIKQKIETTNSESTKKSSKNKSISISLPNLPKVSFASISIKTKLITAGFVMLLFLFFTFNMINSSSKNSTETTNDTSTLGASNGQANSSGILQNGQKLDSVSSTDYELLYPRGKSFEDFDVVVVSPPDQPVVYAFIDEFQGEDLRISEQEIPESMKDDQANGLQELAYNFNAKDIIQVDEVKIYHGYSDKNGGAQSLVFIKDERLIFIASKKKFNDEVWATYVSGLK